MKDKAIVVEIKENSVTVVPLITDACISCTSPCTKRGKPFSVVNKNNFALSKGSIVSIGASKIQQMIQGFFSLLFPIVCSVTGYNICPLFFKNKAVSEGTRMIFVLAFLAVSCSIVFFVSRKNKKLYNSEILEVYN